LGIDTDSGKTGFEWRCRMGSGSGYFRGLLDGF
jgi:hypothetical protein